MKITEDVVRDVFSGLEKGDADAFFAHVADDVDWTVHGTHPLAGRYRSKADVRSKTFARIGAALREPPKLKIEHILVGTEEAAVELSMHRQAESGLPFNNDYCWIVRFDQGRIVEVRAYLDSVQVQRLLQENRA